MSKSDFGEFGFLITFATTFTMISTLGIHVPLVKFLSNEDEKFIKKEIFSTSLLLESFCRYSAA